MGGGMGMGGMPGMGGMGGASSGAARQAPAVEHPLNLSLEELYQGSSKRMRITRKVRCRCRARSGRSDDRVFALLCCRY